MKFLVTFSMAGITALTGLGTASAGPVFYDRAQVVSVREIIRPVRVSTPSRRCRIVTEEEQYDPNRGKRMIIGGILGGILGNQLGHSKHGRRHGRVAGATLGAVIGANMWDKKRHTHVRRRRVCRRVDNYYLEDRVVGYRVWYRYHGRRYHTDLPHIPGRTIRVRVSVEPVYRR